MRTRGVSTPARGDAFEVVAARAGQAPCASTRRPKRATPPPRAPPTKRVATPARRQGSPRESSGGASSPATVTSAEDGSTGVAEAAGDRACAACRGGHRAHTCARGRAPVSESANDARVAAAVALVAACVSRRLETMELRLLEREHTKLMQPGAAAGRGAPVGGHALAAATCHLLKAGSACGPTTLSIFCGEKDSKSHAARTLALLFRRRDRAPAAGAEPAPAAPHPGHIVGAMCTFVVHHVPVTASEARLRAPRPVTALELVTLVTLPELRSHGVAELMLAAVQAVASALGGARALVVNVMSEHATEFFRQSGFRSALSSRAFALDSCAARLENGAARDLRAVFDCPGLCLPFDCVSGALRIGWWRSRRDVPARASQTARASDDEGSDWEGRYEDETDTDEENAREDEDEHARFRAIERVTRRVRATDAAAAVTTEAPGLCLRRSDVVLAGAAALKLRAAAAECDGRPRLAIVPRGSAQDCLSMGRDPASKVRAASVIARSTWQPSPRSVTRGGSPAAGVGGEAPAKPPPRKRAAPRDAAPPQGKVTRAEAISRWGALGLRPKHLQQLTTTEFAVKGKKTWTLFDVAEIEALLASLGVLQRGIAKEQGLECNEPPSAAFAGAVDGFDNARARLLASGVAWFHRVRSLRYEQPYVPSMGRRAPDSPRTPPRARKPALGT